MKRQFLATAALLIVATGVIAFFGWDMATERYFFNRCGCWTAADTGFWRVLYLYGPVPGYLLAAGSLVMVSLSYWNAQLGWWRKPALMMVFCIGIGPGLLVNLIFKDNWGRPRPREVTELGGYAEFLQPWQPGKRGEGKSFPCGHCAIAFYLGLPFLFLRKRYPMIAWGLLIMSLVSGSLTGIARMMAGGHFLSDVVWSWGMVWLSGLAGIAIFRPDKQQVVHQTSRKKAFWATAIVGVLLPILTALVLVATPYLSQKQFAVSQADLRRYRVVAIDCFKGNIQINPADSLTVRYSVYAFGFPGSKVGFAWRPSADTLWGRFEKMGFFTELKNNVQISIPLGSDHHFVFRTHNGELKTSPKLKTERIYLNKD